MILMVKVFNIDQADMAKHFPAPYTSTTYMCFLASFQCIIIALCFDHSTSAWSLANPIRLTSALYSVRYQLHFHLGCIVCEPSYIYSFINVVKCVHWVSGSALHRSGVWAHVVDYWEERPSLCVRFRPLAACHHCFHQLGSASRANIRRNVWKYIILLYVINIKLITYRLWYNLFKHIYVCVIKWFI